MGEKHGNACLSVILCPSGVRLTDKIVWVCKIEQLKNMNVYLSIYIHAPKLN
jgi:hypothetical protein